MAQVIQRSQVRSRSHTFCTPQPVGAKRRQFLNQLLSGIATVTAASLAVGCSTQREISEEKNLQGNVGYNNAYNRATGTWASNLRRLRSRAEMQRIVDEKNWPKEADIRSLFRQVGPYLNRAIDAIENSKFQRLFNIPAPKDEKSEPNLRDVLTDFDFYSKTPIFLYNKKTDEFIIFNEDELTLYNRTSRQAIGFDLVDGIPQQTFIYDLTAKKGESWGKWNAWTQWARAALYFNFEYGFVEHRVPEGAKGMYKLSALPTLQNSE